MSLLFPHQTRAGSLCLPESHTCGVRADELQTEPTQLPDSHMGGESEELCECKVYRM